ncbi:MAG: fibronectin type III domain-containing protein, partial [Clostridium sp.]|nr:fibronectin type III domain-containing protein [Clostridium sp.]
MNKNCKVKAISIILFLSLLIFSQIFVDKVYAGDIAVTPIADITIRPVNNVYDPDAEYLEGGNMDGEYPLTSAIKFDISPVDGTVTNAALKIFITGYSKDTKFNVYGTSDDDWVEKEGTLVLTPTVLLAENISVTSADVYKLKTISLSNLSYFDNKLDKSKVTILIKEGTGGSADSFEFFSSEYSHSVYKPELSISYVTSPTVTTNPTITSITSSSATVNGNVVSDGGLPVTERGVEYKKSSDPESNYVKKVDSETAVGAYSVNLTGLEVATTYDVRAYATNSEGTSYGSVATFSTINNNNPTISDIVDISTDEDIPISISFTVNDDETPAESLVVSATSDNHTLIPNTAYNFGGSGTDRTLTITPELNQYGTANVTVTVSDGSSGTVQDTFKVTVNPVNDAPKLLPFLGLFNIINEDDITNIGNPVFTIVGPMPDVDGPAAQGIAVTATNITTGNGNWQYSTDGGTNWHDIGVVSENSALLLNIMSMVRFVPDEKNGATGSITYRAWDRTSGIEGYKVDTTTNGGTSAFSMNTNTASITVTAVNDALVLSPATPTLTTIYADNTNNAGQTVASFIGASISDVDSEAVEGIAITATANGNGTWQYSIDNGGTWTGIGAVAGNSALLLRDTDKVRFVPNGQDSTTASITYRGWDRTLGSEGNKADTSTNGGVTSFSTATDIASITVNKIPPKIQTVTVPSNGTYKAGYYLDFTVNFNENVDVTGAPQLVLTIGSTTRTATYVSGSGTSTLVFSYTVQAGDNDSNGITVNSLELNGGSIKDSVGNNATLTLNGVVSTAGVKVDTTAPTFSPAIGTVVDGTFKTVTFTFSENILNALVDINALKNAVTFAADGVNYNALGIKDTVTIVSGKLIVTFESSLIGSTNKIKIAGNSLKDEGGNLLTDLITTNSIIIAAAPAAPTGVSATAGNGSAVISFTAPVNNGGSPITGYTVTSNPGNIIATGNGSPITITGLTNGISYTFTVTATNAIGTGLPSVSSNSVTPAAPYIPPSGGGGGSQPNTEPKQERITVNVTDDTNNNVLSETTIQRTTETDGTKKDEVQYTADKAQETVGKLKESGKDTARLVIPDEKDEVVEAEIKIPTTTLSIIAQGNINLQIDTENARISLPKYSIKNLDEDLKKDLFFRVVPIKEEKQRKEIVERAKKEDIVKQAAKGSDISVV